MDQAAVTSFNNQLLKYEGSKKGTMVKAMIQEVLAINAESDNNDSISVQVQFNSESATTTPTTSRIINNNTYEIVMGYDDSSNRINKITVTGTFSAAS